MSFLARPKDRRHCLSLGVAILLAALCSLGTSTLVHAQQEDCESGSCMDENFGSSGPAYETRGYECFDADGTRISCPRYGRKREARPPLFNERSYPEFPIEREYAPGFGTSARLPSTKTQHQRGLRELQKKK